MHQHEVNMAPGHLRTTWVRGGGWISNKRIFYSTQKMQERERGMGVERVKGREETELLLGF